jgi:glycosyltransferase involved in cell wall biosynthesis
VREKVAILIPVYNDESGLNQFLPRLVNAIAQNIEARQNVFEIIVVDDGSTRNVAIQPTPSLEAVKVHLLRHPINLGQGAALQTALEYAKRILNAQLFVTMDSDGQHSEMDLFPMLQTLRNGKLDIVFGNRFSSRTANGIPISRKLLLKAAIAFERALTGLDLNDAHNGFRVFNRKCADKIDLKLNRMAHATEFKQIVKRNRIVYGEHPVQVTYSQDSLAKGQRNSGAFVIIRDLFKTYLFERI